MAGDATTFTWLVFFDFCLVLATFGVNNNQPQWTLPWTSLLWLRRPPLWMLAAQLTGSSSAETQRSRERGEKGMDAVGTLLKGLCFANVLADGAACFYQWAIYIPLFSPINQISTDNPVTTSTTWSIVFLSLMTALLLSGVVYLGISFSPSDGLMDQLRVWNPLRILELQQRRAAQAEYPNYSAAMSQPTYAPQPPQYAPPPPPPPQQVYQMAAPPPMYIQTVQQPQPMMMAQAQPQSRGVAISYL